MKNILNGSMLAAVLVVAASPVLAKDLGSSVWAKERFQIRGRVLDVVADGDGHENVTGLKTDVDHAVTPEIDLTYFFTQNIAAELIAATSKHDINAGANEIGSALDFTPHPDPAISLRAG